MAKGKSSNPADAFRKAQRAKELKKESVFYVMYSTVTYRSVIQNKENRAKVRETATLKKDTSGIETEIHDLEDIGEDKLNSGQKERLKELRAEVARIRKVKQDYVNAHPEQSHLVRGLEPRVRRAEVTTTSSAGGSQTTPAVRAVFGKNGLPLHPERSIYYDPVLNPYGMPPPGMPYAERALLPHEIEQDNEQATVQGDVLNQDSTMDSADSGSDDDESDDDDIVLPAGPPPSGTKQQTSDSESDSEGLDDDIPMPAGPPPPKTAPLPKGPPPTGPLPPATMYGATFPPFPPSAPSYAHAPAHIPPPPPGFPAAYSTYAPPFAQPVPYPQQIVEREQKLRDKQLAEAVRVVQDPLSSIPHVTYQAHQAQRHQLPAPPLAGIGPSAPLQHGLPPKPGGTSQTAASAIISAEPELRDLKKEATAFMPASMRRAIKKGPNTSTESGLHINAAPNDGDQSGPSAEPRKDLMSVLGSQLGVTGKPASGSNAKAGQGKDDYEKFLDEVGSLL